MNVRGCIWTGPYPWTTEGIAGHASPWPSFLDQLHDRPWRDFVLCWPQGQEGNWSAASYYTVDEDCRAAYAWSFRAAQAKRGNLTIGLYTGSTMDHPCERGTPATIVDTDAASVMGWWTYNVQRWRSDFGELSEVVWDAGAMPDRRAEMLRIKPWLAAKMVKSRVEAVIMTPAGQPDAAAALTLPQMGIVRTNRAADGSLYLDYSHPNLPGWTVPAGGDYALALICHAGPTGPETFTTVDQCREFIAKGWTLWPDFAHDALVAEAMKP